MRIDHLTLDVRTYQDTGLGQEETGVPDLRNFVSRGWNGIKTYYSTCIMIETLPVMFLCTVTNFIKRFTNRYILNQSTNATSKIYWQLCFSYSNRTNSLLNKTIVIISQEISTTVNIKNALSTAFKWNESLSNDNCDVITRHMWWLWRQKLGDTNSQRSGGVYLVFTALHI